jgi:hypothetical protein
MRLTNLLTSTVLLCAMCCVCGQAQQLPLALTTGPPHDKAFPAEMETFQIRSGGVLLNALAYLS